MGGDGDTYIIEPAETPLIAPAIPEESPAERPAPVAPEVPDKEPVPSGAKRTGVTLLE
jgi:hypothetical protein